MSFDLLGFGLSPFLSAPAGVFGAVLLAVYAGLGLWLLIHYRTDFQGWGAGRWAGFLVALALGVVLAQVLILRIPANILPPPGVPAEPQRPGLALFALAPAFLAGGLGVAPALLVGLATGLSRALWETRSLATPFEFGFLAAFVAWAARQDYRGWPAAALRHPGVAGLVSAACLWPLLYLSYYAYSQTTGLVGWDYVASLVGAAAPVFVGHAALAGLAVESIRLGMPDWWPTRRGTLPPPYVSSLNRKLLFTLIPLFVVGIGLLFWANITIATRASTTLVVEQMSRAAESAGRQIPFFIQTGRALMRDISALENLMTGDRREQTARLGQSMRTLPFFRQITLFDIDSNPLAGYPASAAENFGLLGDEAELLQLAMLGVPQEATVFRPDPARPVDILFAVPVLDPSTQQPLGALLGRADLVSNPLMRGVTSDLQALVRGSGYGFILNQDSEIIFHPDPTSLRQTFVPEPSATPLATALEAAIAYQDRAPDGTRRLALYYPVPGHPWTVVIMVPNAVVLTLATEIATPVVLILLLIGVIGLILVSIIAGRVTRPAEALAEAAQRISRGELDRPIVVQGEDEIGRAGLAFEHMRERLRARLDELSLLLRTSQAVAASLNLEDALPPILKGALSATGAAGVRLVLLPAEEEVPLGDAPPLHQAFAAGGAAEAMAPLDPGVLNLARDEGRVMIENLARARAVLEVAAVAGRIQAVLALPLRQESSFHGVLWLGYDRPHVFGDTEIDFLTTLASQAAVAAANARLFEAAEQRRQRLAAILASTPDAVVVTDRGGRVVLLNPAAEAVFELVGRVVLGRPAAQVLPHPALVQLMRENRRAAETLEVELSTGRTLYASASPIVGGDGTTLGHVCVLRDVTRFKEVDQMKSEFVATVSHDLRAPLTFMRGYATMLPMVGQLNDKQREFGDKIISGVEQMTKLVDDLLDLGRIEAGVGLSRESMRLDGLVAEIFDAMKPQAANKGLTLDLDAPADLPSLSGDPTLLRQAVTNLMDNAIKYTPSGGQVRVRLSAGSGRLALSVSDSGLGISPADQVHLFEKFFRVKQRGSTQVKGSGLGLAIVKSIVERHGGRISVESKLGRGSTFTMELPLDGAEKPVLAR